MTDEHEKDASVWNEERSIAYHSVLGLIMGMVSAKACMMIHDGIHTVFPRDGILVTGSSLIIQFTIIMAVMVLAMHIVPAFRKELHGTLPSIVWTTWYFGTQVFFNEEIEKIVKGIYD